MCLSSCCIWDRYNRPVVALALLVDIRMQVSRLFLINCPDIFILLGASELEVHSETGELVRERSRNDHSAIRVWRGRAETYMAESWVSTGGYSGNEEAWIPCLMIRRRGGQIPLASNFVSVIEPHDGDAQLTAIRRLPLQTDQGESLPDPNVALEITLATGQRDLFLAADPANAPGQQPGYQQQRTAIQPHGNVSTDAEACWVRRDTDGAPRSIALWQGQHVTVGEVVVVLRKRVDFIQINLAAGSRRGREAVLSDQIDAIRASRFTVLAVCFELSLGALAVVFGWLTGPWPWESLFPSPRTGHVAAILMGGAVALPLFAGIVLVERKPLPWLADLQRIVRHHVVPLFRQSSVGGLLLISLAAGLGEELLFRGYCQAALTDWWGPGSGDMAGGPGRLRLVWDLPLAVQRVRPLGHLYGIGAGDAVPGDRQPAGTDRHPRLVRFSGPSLPGTTGQGRRPRCFPRTRMKKRRLGQNRHEPP